MTIPEKVCPRCGVSKPATLEFYRPMKNGGMGLQGMCKACDLQRKRDLYQRQRQDPAHMEKRRALARRVYSAPEQKAKKQAYQRANMPRILENARKPERIQKARAWRQAWQIQQRRNGVLPKRQYTGAQKKRRSNSVKLYKLRRRQAPGKHGVRDVRKQMAAQKGLCYWCSAPLNGRFQVDHIFPVSKGGSNGPENICCACPECNNSKSDKMPWEFNGRLF